MRQDTLLFLSRDETQEILLAMKKRGFGVGKYNGVGGKVQPGETIAAAAVREAQEEIGVVIDQKDLVQVAELQFSFENKPEWDINGHVFLVRTWTGEPQESEEMAPAWFDRADLPFEKMWVDDKYWLPNVLAGDYIAGTFHFSHDGSELITYRVEGSSRKIA